MFSEEKDAADFVLRAGEKKFLGGIEMIHEQVASHYDEALCVIALLRVVESKTMNHLFSSPTIRSRFIKKAVRMKHIKEIDVEDKKQRKKEILYRICKNGILYLSEKGYGLFEAATLQEDLVLFNNNESRGDTVRTKIAHASTAIIMSYAAGAAIHPLSFGSFKEDFTNELRGDNKDDDGDEQDDIVDDADKEKKYQYTLRNFYRDYITEDSSLSGIALDKNESEVEKIVFYGSGVVKEMLAEETKTKKIRDFLSGRYSGILDSQEKSLLIYVAPRVAISWSHWLTKADMSAYTMWLRNNSITPRKVWMENESTAALIVKNARDFAYHYNAERDGKNKDEVFGGMFKHCYIIPNDTTGVVFLNWLINTNDDEACEAMVEFAVGSGEYVKNNSAKQTPFALRTKHGIETAVCITMDIKQINQIKSIMDRSKKDGSEKKVQILCLDWQKDYLSRILDGNYEYRTFPMSILAH